MPGMDSVETVRRIHELDYSESKTGIRKPRIPIIILVTAYDREIVKELISTDEMVHTLLLKPVKTSQLFNTIMELISRKEASVEIQMQQPAAYPLHQLTGRRVLVVEDSELNQLVVVALLEEVGLIVETAENGRIAVDKVSGSPKDFFDAVLMDIQMPEMDGYEATRNIRAFEKQQVVAIKQPASRIPIIALTAHALKGEKRKCLAAGMDDYLAKPLDEKNLHKVLLKWIAK
jgi:CheY-like chemotaxis protein